METDNKIGSKSNASKTLFELSQTLLKQPRIGAS
jgi:hypothetical protein